MEAVIKNIMLPTLLSGSGTPVDEICNTLDNISEMLNKCYRCPVALSESRCPSDTFPGDDICRSFSNSKYSKR